MIALFALGCKQSELEILQKADELAEKGKYSEAITLCNNVLSEDSTVQLAYFNRGLYYTNTKDYSKAISDFDKIISLQPDEQGARFEVNRDGAFASDEDKLKIFLEEALFQKATAEYLQGNINSSLQDFKLALENGYQPQSKCYLWIGTIYIRNGNEGQGCEMYSKASMLGDSEANQLKEKNCK